jgi:polyhydroxyalkanoate synthesis regulator protein
MDKDDPLLIEVRNGRLYAVEGEGEITRSHIAVMITTGRKYIIHDTETGEDVTRQIGRYFGSFLG